MTRPVLAIHWLVLGGWVLMTPPTPLGTSLPPLSQWQKLSSHESAADCETAREKLRATARHTAAADANAHALQVAAALGHLQSRCIETKDEPKPEPAAEPEPPKPAPETAKPSARKPARK